MLIFIDLEFTNLHQNTTPISIGMIAEDDRTLYCEFNDYELTQIDDWLTVNVIAHLKPIINNLTGHDWQFKGNKEEVANIISMWLSEYRQIEVWGDCLAYDWVLFCELFGGALNLPENIYYIPFDICTLFKLKGIDPDINRIEFSGLTELNQHNSLDDAKTIKACYDNLTRNKSLSHFSVGWLR